MMCNFRRTLIVVIIGFLLFGFAGCSEKKDSIVTTTPKATAETGNKTDTNDEKDYNSLFELNLYSDKQIYKTADKIKIWATLKYIGSEREIKIWHGNPYISFSITDGKNFKTGGTSDDLLTSTLLVKDNLYKFEYVKTGGFSADDPNADYLEKFYKEKDLYLPKGEYTVRVSGAFSLTKNFGENNLFKEMKIRIED